MAWQQTRGLPGFTQDNPPTDHLIWATTAMTNATTGFHIDGKGFGTIVDSITGTKYWVVGRQQRDSIEQGQNGDMASMYGVEWTRDDGVPPCFEYEAVVLQAGTVL